MYYMKYYINIIYIKIMIYYTTSLIYVLDIDCCINFLNVIA